MREHIVAVFNTESAANAAANDLAAAGFPASAIRRYGAQNPQPSSDAPLERTESNSGGGFWAWLLGEEGPQVTSAAYGREGAWYDQRVGEGHTCLSVMVDEDSRIHSAVQILEFHHPVELEESTEEEHSEPERFNEVQNAGGVMRNGVPSNETRVTPPAQTEQTIPLAAEHLEVGKKTVDRGAKRIRRYVVETPVEQDVTLRGERVTIEHRRPVAGSSPDHAFEERVVEVHETEEVPVVAKTAQLTEEVIIRKEATERHETVRDTVRREEVEVTDANSSRKSTAE